MWYSALAAAIALPHEQHLLIGGLGGVIAVIVGGIVSVISMRNVRRSATPPAATPQPAPTSRRGSTPPTYAAPAPPTSPARRLHPGPIALSAPTRPSSDDDDFHHGGIATNLFDPDILDARQGEPGASVPLLRGASDLLAEWRAQTTPAPAHLSAPGHSHAPIWNRSPFAPPEPLTDARAASAISFTSAPPIWHSMGASSPVAPAQSEAEALASFAAPAPIWDSWLHASDTPSAPDLSDASDALRRSAALGEESAECAAPIWPSYLSEK